MTTATLLSARKNDQKRAQAGNNKIELPPATVAQFAASAEAVAARDAASYGDQVAEALQGDAPRAAPDPAPEVKAARAKRPARKPAAVAPAPAAEVTYLGDVAAAPAAGPAAPVVPVSARRIAVACWVLTATLPLALVASLAVSLLPAGAVCAGLAAAVLTAKALHAALVAATTTLVKARVALVWSLTVALAGLLFFAPAAYGGFLVKCLVLMPVANQGLRWAGAGPRD